MKTSLRLTKTDVSECPHSDSQTNISVCVSPMNVEVCGVLKYLNMD